MKIKKRGDKIEAVYRANGQKFYGIGSTYQSAMLECIRIVTKYAPGAIISTARA